MHLTRPQQSTFWRKWNALKRAANWTPEQSESERKALLRRAGFSSLTQVDKLDGFDRVLAELAAITRPDDLDAQMRELNMPKTRLLFAIGKLSAHLSPPRAHLAYACQIARDKFGQTDLESLKDDQLLQLRNTLAARLSAHRHRKQSEDSGHQEQIAA